MRGEGESIPSSIANYLKKNIKGRSGRVSSLVLRMRGEGESIPSSIANYLKKKNRNKGHSFFISVTDEGGRGEHPF